MRLLLLLLGLTACGAAAVPAAAPVDGARRPHVRYVSTGGSDDSGCTRVRPCRSIGRAVGLAASGDVVEIATGRYGAQRLHGGPGHGPAISIRPMAGASVLLAALTLTGARHLELDGLRVASPWSTDPDTADVVLARLVAPGFGITGGARVTVRGGSYGPAVDAFSAVAAAPDGRSPTAIRIDGVDFHDYVRTDDGVHTECLHVAAANGIAIVRNRFRNCAVMDVFVSNWGVGVTTRVDVENNMFGAPRDVRGTGSAYFSLRFNGDLRWRHVLVRNNSAAQTMSFGTDRPGPGRLTDFRVIANVGPQVQYDCDSRIAYAANVWSDARCAPSDRRGAPGFRDPARVDLHLRPTAAAVAHGDRASVPAVDFDGQRRPRGGAPDAGADEL